MVFSKGLALKTTGALAAASATSAGLYYAFDDDMSKLSEFDRELIEFLREDGKKNDIVFEIKKENNDFKETDLTFNTTGGSSDPVKFTVKASIKVPQDTSKQTFFTTKEGAAITDDSALKKIKALNASGWTWECNIEFSKKGTKSELKEDYKKTIFSETKKGLFGILKTKISEQDGTKTENNKWNKYRKTKVEFIKKCGASRGEEKNKEYNNKKGTNSSLTITASPTTIELIDKNNYLAPKSDRQFNYWFKTETEKSK